MAGKLILAGPVNVEPITNKCVSSKNPHGYRAANPATPTGTSTAPKLVKLPSAAI